MEIREVIVVETTTAAKENAERIARRLLDRKVAACVQISKVQSLFRWEGRVEVAEEFKVRAKGLRKHLESMERCIRELHPYDVPEIIAYYAARADTRYLEWMEHSLA